jgi:hypothetical protein
VTVKKPHVPVVRIRTPRPTDDRPFTPAVLTLIEVDGQQWLVHDYRIEGGMGEHMDQKVTLTFIADVVIEH